jgi:hypothetical protein
MNFKQMNQTKEILILVEYTQCEQSEIEAI